MARPLTVIVSGAMANKHLNGGEAWARLNWILGLRRLGCDVHFVEQISPDSCIDETGKPAPLERSSNLAYFRRVMGLFGLGDRSSLIGTDGRDAAGLSHADIQKISANTDVLINISGHLTLPSIFERVRRRAYVDLDPGFTQFWESQGIAGARLEGHDFFFTVGENIGKAGCVIPTCGRTWHPKPRFVVLERWPVTTSGEPRRFTTVGAWRGPFGPVTHEGQVYGLKVHEFRKFISLPTRTSQPFEIALKIDDSDRADLQALVKNGWQVVAPMDVAGDPMAFRAYVQESGAEFSAAQGVYVGTQCGWMSDRTVRYLASGKPALVQDTGFSANYPVGEGLVAFRTIDEAVAGAEDIGRDYARHARAARALAESFFDSDKVLPKLFAQMDLPLGGQP